MNSLACNKRAKRLLMALVTTTSMVLTIACGGNNAPIATPNPVGFSASTLTGTYVFSSSGVDSNGDAFATAGALVANGKGTITGGTMDVVDIGATTPSSGAQAITGGSYGVTTDGRGHVTLTSAPGTFTFDFVLSSASHGLVTEVDTIATGSGTIDLQTAVPSLSQLAGPYAFSLAGSDKTNAPFAAVGAFTLGAGGASTAGVADFHDSATPYIGQPLTATATAGSGTGPGSIALTTTSFPLTFDFYPIDATHLKLIETDDTQFLSGDVFTQTGATIPTGPMVFTMAGGTSAGPVANGGLMTSDGAGNFTAGLEDVNNSGSVAAAQVPFTGAVAAGAGGTVGGRVVVNLTGFTPATQWVIYPSSGGVLLLETDASNLTIGAAYAQTATSFAAPGSFAFSLSGVNGGGVVDDDAQFNTTTAATNNMSGALDENDLGTANASGLSASVPFSGTYTPDSPATGRGSIIIPTTGTIATYLGGLTLEYYVVDSSTVLFIDVDAATVDGGQIGSGTFETQSASAASGAIQSRVSLVRPVVRSPGALQRKQTR